MKSILTLLIFMAYTMTSFAQHIDISEAARAKDNGTYNSFLFELPDVSIKETESDWKDFMRSFKAKTKYNRKAKIWTTENARIPRLSDVPVNIFAKVIEDSNPNKRTSVIVWFDLGDNYLNTETDSLKGAYAYEILTEYALTTSKHHAQEIVKEQEKMLKNLEGDLNKLEKDNKNYHKDIDKAKESISKNEKNIEINELDQKNKAKEIEAQKVAVASAKNKVSEFN